MKKASLPHALPLLCIECALISLAVTLTVLLILSGVCMATSDPCAYIVPCAYLSLVPGALCAGHLCAKRAQKAKQPLGGIPGGLIAGFLYAMLLFVLGLLMPIGADAVIPQAPQLLLTRTAIVLLLSAAAGYAVTHKTPKAHKPKRR